MPTGCARPAPDPFVLGRPGAGLRRRWCPRRLPSPGRVVWGRGAYAGTVVPATTPSMLVLLAGLQAIPEEEKEAARLDGCNRFMVFRFKELPYLYPYFRMVILLGTIFILQAFGEIYVGTAGGPGTSSMNLQYLTYDTAVVGTQIGAASAIGVATLIVTLVILTLLMRSANAVVQEV